jgi:glyoxylase-like metal-dependent hydrolase (beta-lactamase superfamily II)
MAVSALAAPGETKILEVAPGVFFRKAQTEPKFTGCNQGWVIFKDYVLVIEANFPGQVAEVVTEINKTTNKPIRFVFDTHYHGDHADGNVKYLELGATVVAHERSQPLFQTKGLEGFTRAASNGERSAEYGGLQYGIPSLYFSHKLVFDDGEQRVELIFLGHAHTPGDAVAWLPKHRILFTGDACVNGAFNYTGDSNTESWMAVLGAMQELDPKQVAPGHGELSDASLLATQRRYFSELRAEVRKGIDAGRSLDQIKGDIQIPFYKEWAGVDAKTRTENIEHVHGELTAAAKPLNKSTSFNRWLNSPDSDADQRYGLLADLYLEFDSSRRRQMREHFSKHPEEWDSMVQFVRRVGTLVHSTDDIDWVRRGLAIAAIEGGRSDYQETVISLALLRHGAQRGGVEVDGLFRQIQEPEFLSPENKPLFESVRVLAAGPLNDLAVKHGPKP